MKKNTGIWIDHREALVVSMEGDETTVLHIESAAESHFKPSGGWKASGTAVAQSVSNEHSDEERRKHQYHIFYQNVIKLLGDSDAIVIFGAGEAKTELAKEMESTGIFHGKVRGVETSARITENQFIAKVKEFF
ncbi:MAG: hypothetical protein HGA62_04810 [Chlorobiaceae bacterium]|nr:hypothetical protein [Chlorobiaceae bacterium]NTV60759.1 hypothetical protein [Chlorobiaceae bacterium]